MKNILTLFLAAVFFIFKLCAYQDKFEIIVNQHPAPRNGPPYIHWCTMCGADNRYEMLKETIEIIEPYFDQIHIVDNGSTDATPTLALLSPKVIYTRLENWDGNWPKCYFESIRGVCEGEWFIFHDSDERPSPEFLKNLKTITQWANRYRFNTIGVQSCHHSYSDDGAVISIYADVISKPGYEKQNFIKRQDMVINAFGGHTGFHLMRPRVRSLWDLNPHFFYNHYKSASSTRISGFAHGFMYPTTFDGLKPFANEIIKLREELGIVSIQQLFSMLHSKEIPQKMRELISKWEFADREAKEVWELIIRDNCQFNLPTFCNKPCCAYKNS